ncbi:phage holin family protein [Jannaschia sp. R86511]|uniref:phage holin family protein n=1 Tax=Jannaschia sp. R86511 TaxID=3093853 RepID=UPI0036D3206F
MSTADPYGGPVGATGNTREELHQESFGDLLSGLATDMSTLVKQEIELAKVETTAKAKGLGKGVGMLVGAGVVGLLALMTLTTLLVVVLDAFLELWLAVLIVLVLWSVVAAVLGLQGRKKLQDAAPPVPTETVETVKEDVAWAKHPTSSART